VKNRIRSQPLVCPDRRHPQGSVGNASDCGIGGASRGHGFK